MTPVESEHETHHDPLCSDHRRCTPPQDAPAIRWGILGAGWISESFAQAVTERTASTIAAVASRDSAKAQTFIDSHLPKDSPATAYGSYEELVGDESLDAIYIGTPTPTTVTMRCLRFALENTS